MHPDEGIRSACIFELSFLIKPGSLLLFPPDILLLDFLLAFYHTASTVITFGLAIASGRPASGTALIVYYLCPYYLLIGTHAESSACFVQRLADQTDYLPDVVNASGGNLVLAAKLFGNSPAVACKNYYTGINESDALAALNRRRLSQGKS